MLDIDNTELSIISDIEMLDAMYARVSIDSTLEESTLYKRYTTNLEGIRNKAKGIREKVVNFIKKLKNKIMTGINRYESKTKKLRDAFKADDLFMFNKLPANERLSMLHKITGLLELASISDTKLDNKNVLTLVTDSLIRNYESGIELLVDNIDSKGDIKNKNRNTRPVTKGLMSKINKKAGHTVITDRVDSTSMIYTVSGSTIKYFTVSTKASNTEATIRKKIKLSKFHASSIEHANNSILKVMPEEKDFNKLIDVILKSIKLFEKETETQYDIVDHIDKIYESAKKDDKLSEYTLLEDIYHIAPKIVYNRIAGTNKMIEDAISIISIIVDTSGD